MGGVSPGALVHECYQPASSVKLAIGPFLYDVKSASNRVSGAVHRGQPGLHPWVGYR